MDTNNVSPICLSSYKKHHFFAELYLAQDFSIQILTYKMGKPFFIHYFAGDLAKTWKRDKDQ